MYDFHKVKRSTNETEFRHRLFTRGNKNQLSSIKRKVSERESRDNILYKRGEGNNLNQTLSNLILRVSIT